MSRAKKETQVDKIGTKEKILLQALSLFAKRGYDGASMSDIAAPLGITKAALYKHFKSKQEIFDSIIAESNRRYEEVYEKLSFHPDSEADLGTDSGAGADSESGADSDTHKKNGIHTEDLKVYGNIEADELCKNVLEFVRFSLSDEFSRQVRHMLTLSQFASKDLAQLYTDRYINAMIDYDERLFKILMDSGVMKKNDPRQMAVYFASPVIMYIGICDRHPEREKECLATIDKHVRHFFEMTRL